MRIKYYGGAFHYYGKHGASFVLGTSTQQLVVALLVKHGSRFVLSFMKRYILIEFARVYATNCPILVNSDKLRNLLSHNVNNQ